MQSFQQAAYITSTLQQLIPNVRVEHLVTANDMLKKVMELEPKIAFHPQPPASEIKEVIVTSSSDASFNHGTRSGYGQTGLLTGLRIIRSEGADIFHTIDWCTNKQRRVSYSPYGAEVLACADADDRGYYLKSGLLSLFSSLKTRSELCTDSRCLYDTITTLHEAKYYRLRPTVERIRNCFDSQELDFMRWIPGDANPADELTKRNRITFKLLNRLISSGIICMQIESGYEVSSFELQKTSLHSLTFARPGGIGYLRIDTMSLLHYD